MRRALPLLLACLVLVLSACATAGGVQVEGPASQVKPPPTTPPPPSDVTPSVDAVTVLRADPKVSDKIKAALTPCLEDQYPVSSRYVDLTRDGVPELIVTVLTCDSKVTSPIDVNGVYFYYALANYVYSVKATPTTQLFASENPGEYLNPQPEYGFTLARPSYRPKDKSCCPTDQQTVAYKWTGTTFESRK
jgi:hypothetical protein